jgi:hypothetical protein
VHDVFVVKHKHDVEPHVHVMHGWLGLDYLINRKRLKHSFQAYILIMLCMDVMRLFYKS